MELQFQHIDVKFLQIRNILSTKKMIYYLVLIVLFRAMESFETAKKRRKVENGFENPTRLHIKDNTAEEIRYESYDMSNQEYLKFNLILD